MHSESIHKKGICNERATRIASRHVFGRNERAKPALRSSKVDLVVVKARDLPQQ